VAGELITADGQLQWRNTLLGTGTMFATKLVSGWYDLPGQRGTNPALPSRHGAYPGRKLSTERLIEWQFKTTGVALSGFPAQISTLRQITAPAEDPQEEQLAIRLDGVTLMCNARCVRRSIPTDAMYALGYTEGVVQWEATDPRVYSATEMSATAGLPASVTTGLDFSTGGLSFTPGLDFGVAVTGGQVTVTNTGHVPTWPRLEISGPVTGPVITWPSGRQLAFDPSFTVSSGQTLVIDTRPGARTVLIAGVSQRSRLWTQQWSSLDPGVSTQLTFTAAGGYSAGLLTVYWRHAMH
jgi:hypothetical protein